MRLLDVYPTAELIYIALEFCPDGDFRHLLDRSGGKSLKLTLQAN